MKIVLNLEYHALLDAAVFVTRFQNSLGNLSSSTEFAQGFSLEASSPLQPSDEIRSAIRELLRQNGFKPTGRNKPAAEYLLRAASEQKLASINPAVDFCNIVSLHSGLPISVVDLDQMAEPLAIKVAPNGASYIFNPSGQEIQIGGLLSLFDQHGACANAVKDSQRTKTGPDTQTTLSVVWGTQQLPGRTARSMMWYRQLLADFGANTCDVSIGTLEKPAT